MNWTKDLSSTPTTESVVELANEYLSVLGPGFLSKLPIHCRPRAVSGPEEIHEWRTRLWHEANGKVDGGASESLEDLLVFFSLASNRIVAIEHDRPSPQ